MQPVGLKRGLQKPYPGFSLFDFETVGYTAPDFLRTFRAVFLRLPRYGVGSPHRWQMIVLSMIGLLRLAKPVQHALFASLQRNRRVPLQVAIALGQLAAVGDLHLPL